MLSKAYFGKHQTSSRKSLSSRYYLQSVLCCPKKDINISNILILLTGCEVQSGRCVMARVSSIITIMILVVLCSCTGHIRDEMSLWEGRHFSQVLVTWGEPSEAYDDLTGGGLLVYHTRSLFSPPKTDPDYYDRSITYHSNWNSYSGTREQIDPDSYKPSAPSYRIFYVDSNGVVYHINWKGY